MSVNKSQWLEHVKYKNMKNNIRRLGFGNAVSYDSNLKYLLLRFLPKKNISYVIHAACLYVILRRVRESTAKEMNAMDEQDCAGFYLKIIHISKKIMLRLLYNF